MDPATRVQVLIEPVLVAGGFELVDVQFARGALQVFVDRPGGIDLDAVAAASTTVSQLLDEADPVPGPYTLEVSSPGLERPLRRPEHFRRFLGTTVAVKTRPEVEGERRLRGPLEAADDEGILVAGRRLRYDEVERARTVFEWGPAPKPGSRPAETKADSSAGKRAVS